MHDRYDDAYADLDPEGPSPEDLERFSRDDALGHSGTIKCQQCREAIYDDADVCPYCGTFQLHGARRTRRSLWMVVVAIIVLMAFLFGYVI
jgi:predicted nucleic acid-binding Zn ribbon protein